jgi:small subunit ribosomal protein S10e
MQSLTSKGFVKTQFSWQWYYYTLTDEGIDYLRECKYILNALQKKRPGNELLFIDLHLPQEIVPATMKKSARPAAPRRACKYLNE